MKTSTSANTWDNQITSCLFRKISRLLIIQIVLLNYYDCFESRIIKQSNRPTRFSIESVACESNELLKGLRTIFRNVLELKENMLGDHFDIF